jgi:hypothetical protein
MHRAMTRRLRALARLAIAVLAASISGCGGDPEPTQTVTERVVTEQRTVTEKAPSATDESVPPEEPSRARRIKVPNVVGKNHQAAQNKMQAAGLFVLAEEDATGQGRALVLDRSWKVVSQSPAPGKRVSEDKTITLRSKKIGE